MYDMWIKVKVEVGLKGLTNREFVEVAGCAHVLLNKKTNALHSGKGETGL